MAYKDPARRKAYDTAYRVAHRAELKDLYPVFDFHFKWGTRSYSRRGNAFGSIAGYFVLAGVVSDTSLIIVDTIFKLGTNGAKFRLGLGRGANKQRPNLLQSLAGRHQRPRSAVS